MIDMSINTPLAWAPNLEGAIERHPLIVAPTTPLLDVINIISQAHSHTCSLVDDLLNSDLQPKGIRASCVLVMQGSSIVGILTERDVVRLTAEAINFAETTVADVMVHPVITLPEDSIQDIFAALFLFRRYRIRHLPIVDRQEKLVGVISHESIRQVLRPVNLLRSLRVSDVMATQVVQSPLTATVRQVGKLMANRRVSCVVITQRDDEGNDRPVGIMTERDIVQCQALQINLTKTQVQHVMSTPLFLLSPEDSLWTAHQEMQKRRVGRLVVSWNWGQNLGIVTQTSLLKIFDPMEMYGVIENLQQTIQQLITNAPVPNQSAALPTLSEVLPLQQLSQEEKEQDPDEVDPVVLLDRIHNSLEYLVSHLDLSVERRRLRLYGILDLFAQLRSAILCEKNSKKSTR
jgi:CBS domain-containing protein